MSFLVSFSFLALGFGGGVAGGAPPTKYVGLALTNTIGPACGMFALQNIPYPAQVLTKSCKMVPVMIMGTIFYRKRYSAVCGKLISQILRAHASGGDREGGVLASPGDGSDFGDRAEVDGGEGGMTTLRGLLTARWAAMNEREPSLLGAL